MQCATYNVHCEGRRRMKVNHFDLRNARMEVLSTPRNSSRMSRTTREGERWRNSVTSRYKTIEATWAVEAQRGFLSICPVLRSTGCLNSAIVLTIRLAMLPIREKLSVLKLNLMFAASFGGWASGECSACLQAVACDEQNFSLICNSRIAFVFENFLCILQQRIFC